MIVLYFGRKSFGRMLISFHEGIFQPNPNRGGVLEIEIIYKTWYLAGMNVSSDGRNGAVWNIIFFSSSLYRA